MRDPQINSKDGKKVVFGPVRLSYTHLFKPYAPNGSDKAKYMTNVLIPKSETKTIEALNKAIQTARREALVSKWNGKEPKKVDLPLRDGDDKDDPTYHGHFYLNAKAVTRPGVVDKYKNPITDEEEVYSGMWAVVSITFYGYDVSGNKGVSAGLNNVMKYKDDERLGGRVSAESDFEGWDDEDDDEL